MVSTAHYQGLSGASRWKRHSVRQQAQIKRGPVLEGCSCLGLLCPHNILLAASPALSPAISSIYVLWEPISKSSAVLLLMGTCQTEPSAEALCKTLSTRLLSCYLGTSPLPHISQGLAAKPGSPAELPRGWEPAGCSAVPSRCPEPRRQQQLTHSKCYLQCERALTSMCWIKHLVLMSKSTGAVWTQVTWGDTSGNTRIKGWGAGRAEEKLFRII